MLTLVAKAKDIALYRGIKQEHARAGKTMRFRRVDVDEKARQVTFNCGDGIGSLVYSGRGRVQLKNPLDKIIPIFKIDQKPDEKIDSRDKFLAWLRNMAGLLIRTWNNQFSSTETVKSSPMVDSVCSWQKASFRVLANSIPGRTSLSAILNLGLLTLDQPPADTDSTILSMNVSCRANAKVRPRNYTLRIKYNAETSEFRFDLHSFTEGQAISFSLSRAEAAKIKRPRNGVSSSLIHQKIYAFVQENLKTHQEVLDSTKPSPAMILARAETKTKAKAKTKTVEVIEKFLRGAVTVKYKQDSGNPKAVEPLQRAFAKNRRLKESQATKDVLRFISEDDDGQDLIRLAMLKSSLDFSANGLSFSIKVDNGNSFNIRIDNISKLKGNQVISSLVNRLMELKA